jgi:ribonuclease I
MITSKERRFKMQKIDPVIEKIIQSQLKVTPGKTNLRDLGVTIVDEYNLSHDEWEKDCGHYFKEVAEYYTKRIRVFNDIPYGDFYAVNDDGVILGCTQNNFFDLRLSTKEDVFNYRGDTYILKDDGTLYIKLQGI